MSKSKLRGIVGYTCYTRPSLQCTHLSSLKPGKTANEEGSFLPHAFRGRYERASTAPAGKTRTINNLMSTQLNEESYSNLERPNPLYDTESTVERDPNRPVTKHWKSINKQSFPGTEGLPAEPSPQMRDDTPMVGKPAEMPEEKSVNVMEMARSHAAKKTAARPHTVHNNRMRPRQDTGPRPESRDGQSLLRGTHRGGVAGTSHASRQIPGYGGFMPKSESNEHAQSHGFGEDTRTSLKETLFECYRKVLPGYTGFQPASVHNVRTFDVPLVTSYGSQNHSMVELGRELKRPEAGGESLILKEMFQAPLEGRPSDNGLTNAQTYYQLMRPYEGLPRIHYPSKTHMVGCKFASTTVATMGDSGVNSPMKMSRGNRASRAA